MDRAGSGSSGLSLRRFGVLFIPGLLGIIALFATGDTALYEEAAAASGLSVDALRVLAAVQSLVLLGVAVLVGLYVAPKAGLRSHLLNWVSSGVPLSPAIRAELRPALGIGALVGGMLVVAEGVAPTPIDGPATATAGMLLESLPMRVLYGGITEELLLRWGLMSVVVVLVWRVRGRNEALPPSGVIWKAIIASAILFGVGHLPAAASRYGTITADVLAFILLGNGLAGIAFGWLYWRCSLEAAMIAHGFAHVVAVSGSIVLLA